MSRDAEKISIYIKILNFIENQNKREFYPKTADIINYLNSIEYNISDRTLNRYINAISTEFDVAIEKTSHQGGYYINKEDSIYFDDIFQTLELVDKALYFKNLLNQSTKILQYFSFSATNFKGFEWIDKVVKAIDKKYILKLKHKRFTSQIVTEREIEPYLLKEYLGRWYVVGYDRLKKENRSFGLDRIMNIEVLDKKFKKVKTKEIKKNFENTIGLDFSKPELVTLSFNKNTKNYFITNPWHKEYEIIKDDKNELIVKFFISVNYELIQRILMHNKNIKVIEPNSLKRKILALMKEAIEQY